MAQLVGIVGRYVLVKVERSGAIEPEACEVMACELPAGYGWRLLVATHDGTLLSVEVASARLVLSPSTDGPFR